MGPELTVLLVFTGSIGFAVLVIVLAARQSEKVYRRVVQLAEELGLTPETVRPKLGFWAVPRSTGQLRGRSAELYAYTTGSGKSRTSWCALAVRPATAGGLTFQLTPQGFSTKIAALFGAKEITVGEKAFDDAWFIQTNQPDFLQAALLPEICSRIMTAVVEGSRPMRSGTFKLEGDRLTYSEVGDFGDEERCARFRRVADVLGDFAAIAEVAANAPR